MTLHIDRLKNGILADIAPPCPPSVRHPALPLDNALCAPSTSPGDPLRNNIKWGCWCLFTSFGAGRVLPLFWSCCRPFLGIAHHRLHPARLKGHGRSHSNFSNILKIFFLRCQNPHRCTTWWSLAAALLWAGLPQTSGTVEEGEEEFWKPSSTPQFLNYRSLGEAGLESPGSTCPGATASQVFNFLDFNFDLEPV